MSATSRPRLVKVSASGTGKDVTLSPVEWIDRPTPHRIGPAPDATPVNPAPRRSNSMHLASSNDRASRMAAAATLDKLPVPNVIHDSEDYYAVSGLGAYRSYRRWPGKSFPNLGLTVSDRPREPKATVIVDAL